jgi:DNA-binding NtrC family response regulator
VLLPLHGGRTRVRPPTPIALPGLTAAHVLLVEDEAAIRKVVKRLLESVGHHVSTVGGTREAIAWLDEPRDVAVVLLDRSMPDGLGETIIPHLRRHLPNAQILLFTGQDVEPEIAALADGVLAKPVTSDDLLRAVDGALKARK